MNLVIAGGVVAGMVADEARPTGRTEAGVARAVQFSQDAWRPVWRVRRNFYGAKVPLYGGMTKNYCVKYAQRFVKRAD